MKELDDLLQHAGVKGMKWGVIRWRKPGGEGRQPGRIKQELDSMKRERHWKKVIENIDKMSTKEIGTITKRVQLENEMKRLSKSKIASAKDKRDYRLREKMSDEELTRKVGRLRAKNALMTQYDSATKEQREFGKRVVQTGGSLAIKYALNKKVTVGDVYESVANPKAAQQQAVKTMLDTMVKTAKERKKK